MQHPPRIQYHQSPYSHKEIHKELENAKKQVIDFELVQDNVLTYLSSQVKDFHAGQLSEHLSDWKSITSDQSILEFTSGEKIESVSAIPLQTSYPSNSVSKEHKEEVEF